MRAKSYPDSTAFAKPSTVSSNCNLTLLDRLLQSDNLKFLMDKTEDFVINRLTWKAKKYNLPTSSSFFYNDLSPDVHQYLKTYTDQATSGQPVLFFTKPTSEWTLVCSRQIICNDNKQVFKINIQDIEKFKPTVFDSASKGQLIDLNENKKSEWHQVTIVDKHKNSYILHADKGSDLFALWNILLMAARLYD